MPTRHTAPPDDHDDTTVEIAFALLTSALLAAGSGLVAWLTFTALGRPTNERIVNIVVLAVLIVRTVFVLRRFDIAHRRTQE